MKAPSTIIYASAILCSLIAEQAFSQIWTPANTAPNYWETVAMTPDGTKMFAGAGSDHIYVSTNSGMTWSANTNSPIDQWRCIALSTDGTQISAAALNSRIWISRDSGITWSNSGPYAPLGEASQWSSIASSADGSKLVAVVSELHGFPGPIYFSTDSGFTWAPANVQSNSWESVASSADGTILIASSSVGAVYTSSDAGSNWAPTTLPVQSWRSVAISPGGTNMLALDYSAEVYFSSNSGSSWTQRTNIPLSIDNISDALACSADLSKMVLGAHTGFFPAANNTYLSADYGNTWVRDLNAPNNYWFSIAASADGSTILAGSRPLGAGGQGPLFVSHPPYVPALKIGFASPNLKLSWPSSVSNVVLQQTVNLRATNWVALTNVPTLNPASQREEVTLPPPSGNAYYRLTVP